MNKILFVDDEESIRLLYADEFTEEGYHVITSKGDDNLLEIVLKEGCKWECFQEVA